MSRVVLLASAWAADDVDLAAVSDEASDAAPAWFGPDFPPLSGTAALSRQPYAAAATGVQGSSSTADGRSTRTIDRVSAAAGAVIGAVATATLMGATRLRRH